MPYQYTPSTKLLKELPTMEMPNIAALTIGDYSEAYKEYQHHLSSLRSYPIVGEIPSHWVEGYEVQDGEVTILTAQDARLFSDILGIDHKIMPLKGEVAFYRRPDTIPAKLDSAHGAFQSEPYERILKKDLRSGQASIDLNQQP